MPTAKPFAVFDLETDPFQHGRFPRPFCAGFFDGRSYRSFWGGNCVAEVARIIAQFPGLVYAHNGGRFDAIYLLDYLQIDKPIFFTKINHRIASLPFGVADVRDSYLLLPVKLAAFDKLKVDYSDFEVEKRDAKRAEIEKYLEMDCRYLYQTLEKFFSEYGRGITLANRAFSQLRATGIKPERTSLDWDKNFRRFYFGGRTQALRPGEHAVGGGRTLKIFDINSAYPQSMVLPHWWGADYMELAGLPKKGVENCMIEFEGESWGAVPVRNPKTGGLMFPNGKVDACITGWEFVAGLETGRIKPSRIKGVYRPWKVQSFHTYVDHFWKLKAEATKNKDRTRREFAKLMLNSAYGKFALNPETFTDNCLAPLGFSPGAEWGEPVSVNMERGYCEFEKPTELEISPCYNVATAASITGWVRSFLLRSLCSVDRPLYCDTDSIICHGPGNLKLGDELGEWKTEAEGDYFACAGKKLYAFRTLKKATDENLEKEGPTKDDDIKLHVHQGRIWKTACKGARLTPAEIIRVVKGETVRWKNPAPTLSVNGRSRLWVERRIQRTNVEPANFD